MNPSDRIVIEIGLIDHAVRGSNCPRKGDADPKNRGPFHLGFNVGRIDSCATIDRNTDLRNLDEPRFCHFHFDDRGYIGICIAVGGDAQALSFSKFSITPSCFLRRNLRNPTQTPNIERETSSSLVIGDLQIEDAGFSEQI